MAQIVINEISQNYTFNIGTNAYATVAMPVTACWGPGYFDPTSFYSAESSSDVDSGVQRMMERTVWQRFPATQQGMEAFVSTYRGPAACYRMAKDFSYQMALTLLTAGYDILVCRLCPGSQAENSFTQDQSNASITFRAKYPGTFGNNLQIVINKVSYFDRDAVDTGYRKYYWNVITYVIDASGTRTAVESKSFVFNVANATDTVLHYKEVESDFWNIVSVEGTIQEDASAAIPTGSDGQPYIQLSGGSDYNTEIDRSIINEGSTTIPSLKQLIDVRYQWAREYQLSSDANNNYANKANQLIAETGQSGDYVISDDLAKVLYYREWLFTSAVCTNAVATYAYDLDDELVGGVYDLLKDKLTYNPQRLISPGWDDQDLYMYTDDQNEINDAYQQTAGTDTCKVPISPMHLKIMDVAYYSRCATGLIDTPHVVDRRFVHIESDDTSNQGYIQKLARIIPKNAALDTNGTLFHTHSAFFAPWGQYTYVGTSKQNPASPSFQALMIQRAQILNQPTQYEWALPTNRSHSLKLGKLDYTVPKKVLDRWQKLDGASVNVITTIPDLGTNLWGNSTLYEVPPITYQPLANLSTRYLVNAVEDCAYRCGIAITFQYNNAQAYNKFYAGVTPLLDTMKNVGAIDDYRVEMSADINSLDHVNANTIIGKIWLVVNGVVNDIYVDLICLPAGLDIDLASLS